MELSAKYSIPLVATNDNHFLDRDDQPAHDLLICIGTGRTIEDESRMKYTWEHYFKTGDASLHNFFAKTAEMSKTDYYLYDHEPITKHKITFDMVTRLMEIPQVKGIKSGDLVMIKQLSEHVTEEDFSPVFSGSDLFDVAHAFGITRCLDGKCLEVLVCRFIDDMSQDETAAFVGASRRTIGKREKKIRDQVRNLRNGAES